jgi:hypothetical protein
LLGQEKSRRVNVRSATLGGLRGKSSLSGFRAVLSIGAVVEIADRQMTLQELWIDELVKIGEGTYRKYFLTTAC